MDLTSRLRSIVRPQNSPPRELTYEPDTGRYEASIDVDRMADVLGGQVVTNRFGRALVIDRRYESDRFHGSRRVGECEVPDGDTLRLLDPTLPVPDGERDRTLFVDLETTGLSGGAGTVAFLVGCGWFDMGAFQVRQFLLTSYASERALLDAVASCFDAASLLVTYNGKTFDVPVMETRWSFHRMRMPLESVRHFDMLHPARRLWRGPARLTASQTLGCRLGGLEQRIIGFERRDDVDGMAIPARYFEFLRTGDSRPLLSVLEHNRLDLLSLAIIMREAAYLVQHGADASRTGEEALGLGRVYERASKIDLAEKCLRRAAVRGEPPAVRCEALYRLGLLLRRQRRHEDASLSWGELLRDAQSLDKSAPNLELFAAEALAVHHEHRRRDLAAARRYAAFVVSKSAGKINDTARHRLDRIDRKIYRAGPLLPDV